MSSQQTKIEVLLKKAAMDRLALNFRVEELMQMLKEDGYTTKPFTPEQIKWLQSNFSYIYCSIKLMAADRRMLEKQILIGTMVIPMGMPTAAKPIGIETLEDVEKTVEDTHKEMDEADIKIIAWLNDHITLFKLDRLEISQV
jgi:hypothetical protein